MHSQVIIKRDSSTLIVSGPWSCHSLCYISCFTSFTQKLCQYSILAYAITSGSKAESERNDFKCLSEREWLFVSRSMLLSSRMSRWVDGELRIHTANWPWSWERDLRLALVSWRNWSQLDFTGQVVQSCSVLYKCVYIESKQAPFFNHLVP